MFKIKGLFVYCPLIFLGTVISLLKKILKDTAELKLQVAELASAKIQQVSEENEYEPLATKFPLTSLEDIDKFEEFLRGDERNIILLVRIPVLHFEDVLVFIFRKNTLQG